LQNAMLHCMKYLNIEMRRSQINMMDNEMRKITDDEVFVAMAK